MAMATTKEKGVKKLVELCWMFHLQRADGRSFQMDPEKHGAV